VDTAVVVITTTMGWQSSSLRSVPVATEHPVEAVLIVAGLSLLGYPGSDRGTVLGPASAMS
jgi:hypothetical protein